RVVRFRLVLIALAYYDVLPGGEGGRLRRRRQSTSPVAGALTSVARRRHSEGATLHRPDPAAAASSHQALEQAEAAMPSECLCSWPGGGRRLPPRTRAH